MDRLIQPRSFIPPMINIIKHTWIHVVIWAAMAAYFFFSPVVYDDYVTRNLAVKPVEFQGELPRRTSKGKVSIDGMSPVKTASGDQLRMKGWAFLTLNARLTPGDYERSIVLQSEDNTYILAVTPADNPRIAKTYKDLGLKLTNAGFYTDITQAALAPGTYKISLIFKEPSGKSYLLRTNRFLVRSVNLLELH